MIYAKNPTAYTEAASATLPDRGERALLERVLKLTSYTFHVDESVILYPGQRQSILRAVEMETDTLVEVLGGWDRPVIVLDTAEEEKFRPLLACTGARFLAGAPVRSGGLAIAYLLIAGYSPRSVAIAPDIEVLCEFARVLASLLELQLVASEARNAEYKAREIEDRFRSTANSAPILIWTATADGSWAFVNHAWLEFTGCMDSQLLCEGWLDQVHPEDREQCYERWLQAVANRSPYQMEHRIRSRSGGYRWVVNQALPRFLPDGAFSGFVGSCTDITHLYLEAHNLAAESHISAPGWEASGALVVLLDPSGRILRINAAAAATLRLSPQMDLHKHIWDVLAKPEDGQAIQKAVRLVAEQKSARTVETRHTNEMCGAGVISWTLQAQQDEYGCVNHIICSGHDTTGETRIEQLLCRTAAVVETADDAIYHTNRSGTILAWNGAAERLFGYTEKEILGKSVSLLIPPEGQSEFELLLARIEAGEPTSRRNTTRLHKDGRRVPVAITASAVRDALGKLIGKVVVARDLTEKEQRDAELRKKDALCRALIENAVDVIAMVDAAGTIMFISPSCQELLGWHTDEMIGRNRLEFYHPHDRGAAQALLDKIRTAPESTACGQLRFRKRDGSYCRIACRVRNVLHDAELAGILINARVVEDET